jgi:hypothetical protein
METEYPATAGKNRMHLFIIAIAAAVAILSTVAFASMIPFIGVKPVPPSSSNPSPTTTAPAPVSTNPAPQPVAVTTAPALVQPKKTSSHNWAGYAVIADPGSVSDVKGSWVVPAVSSPTGSDGFSAFWVGIDGFGSRTVEQIGTESDYLSGSPQYYAWFEMYPDYPHIVQISVSPGDQISAEVKYAGGGVFTLSISDLTTGQSFQINTVASGADRSSAEWIAEAPYDGGVLPLADFSKAYFGPGNYVTMNGVTSPLGTVSLLYQITMGSPRNVLAQTSPLSSDGLSFSVQQTGLLLS